MNKTVVFASFHATPGTGRCGGTVVSGLKPFFHGAVATELARMNCPFVFGIDANEPRSESLHTIEFHWADGRPGAKKLQALLGLNPMHQGRDMLREWMTCTGAQPASADLLLPTYAPSTKFQRRFDSIWATPEFEVLDFTTHLEEVVLAGGDHALLVAGLRFG
jgi:hypothetical protein